MISFTLNGKPVSYDGDPNMPLLWYVREQAGLTGSKFGCGVSLCGACTMHLNGAPIRACSTPVAAVKSGDITTIEGLSTQTARAVQAAWEELDVVQCGYCQSGQIMSAIALLTENPAPSDEDVNAAMSGNLCRCATYHRVRAAIRHASETLQA
jgi:isoquinoline 1-oxidoreductase alpha subunit